MKLHGSPGTSGEVSRDEGVRHTGSGRVCVPIGRVSYEIAGARLHGKMFA